MIGKFITNAMSKALKLGARVASKVATASRYVIKSKAARFAATSVKSLGTKMMKNLGSRKWWGKAVRVIRSRKKFIGLMGKMGKALSSAGGGLGWLGRGLSAFDIDFRSPREFKKDMKDQQKHLEILKTKRSALIRKELEAQDELKSNPIDISGLETPEEKLDKLGDHLNTMKVAIGDIKGTSMETGTNIKGFEKYQTSTNNALAEAITTGDQKNLAATIKGIEETKDITKAISMDATQTTISEISGKMDAIEEQRKEEEALRRKNDWKRKFLNAVLWLADWILNWPIKLAIMGAKLLLGLGLVIAANIRPIKAILNTGFKGVLDYINNRVTQLGSWLIEKLINGVSSLLSFLLVNVTDSIGMMVKGLGYLFFSDTLKDAGTAIIEGGEKSGDDMKSWIDKYIGGAFDSARELSKLKAENNMKAALSRLNSDELKKAAVDSARDSIASTDINASSNNTVDSILGINFDRDKGPTVFDKAASAVGEATGKLVKSVDELGIKHESAITDITNTTTDIVKGGVKASMEFMEKSSEIIKETVKEGIKDGIKEAQILSEQTSTGYAKGRYDDLPPTKTEQNASPAEKQWWDLGTTLVQNHNNKS